MPGFLSKRKSLLTLPGSGKKNALLSYIKDSFLYRDNDPRLNDHTSKWESLEIGRILQKLGYSVDVVDYHDASFFPQKEYDLLFDIHYNIDRLAMLLPPHCLKILHITGSYPAYSIAQELARVEALEARKQAHYSPKRVVDNVYFTRSMQKADFCTLFGNDFTISTFPEGLRHKIHLITPTASQMAHQKEKAEFVPNQNSFLWFYGAGAVHKGLDLLLDIFARRPEIHLHIIGGVDREKDFCAIYKKELFNTPNIHFHGFVNPLDKKFSPIIRQCFCFLAPSCSESLSVAAATSMKAGLYPVLSRQNGIDLPAGCGIILEDVTHDTLEASIDKVMSLPIETIAEQIALSQRQALDLYSRDAFTRHMTQALREAQDKKR